MVIVGWVKACVSSVYASAVNNKGMAVRPFGTPWRLRRLLLLVVTVPHGVTAPPGRGLAAVFVLVST